MKKGRNKPKIQDGAKPLRHFKLPGWILWFLRMGWFRNFKIGVKLTLSFAIVAIIAGAIGLVGTVNIYKLNQGVQSIYQDSVKSLEPLHKIALGFQQVQTNLAYCLMDAIDHNNIDTYEQTITKEKAEIETALQDCEKNFTASKNPQVNSFNLEFQSFKKNLTAYWEEEQQVLQLAKAGKTTEAKKYWNDKVKNFSANIGANIDMFFLISNSIAEICTRDSNTAAEQTIWFMLIMVGVGMLIAIGLGWIISRMIGKPLKQLTGAAEQLALGNVEVAVAATSKDEIGKLSNAFIKMVESIREQAGVAEKLAAGDLNVAVNAKSEQDLLAKSMTVVIQTLREVIAEIKKLNDAAGEGRLSARGDAGKFSGEYRQVIEGVNTTLDAVVGPLSMAAVCIDQIGKGEIPPPITAEYRGDFNTIKNSLNNCITGLGALTESSGILQRMALNDYAQKVEGNYQGVFGDIGTAINEVRASLLNVQRIFGNISKGDFQQDLTDLKQVGRCSANDQLVPSFIQMMETVLNMVNETIQLSEAAIRGKLNVRGDAVKFKGEYRRVIEGFNATMDGVIAPLTEAGMVLGKLAVNDFTQKVTGEYQGILKEYTNQVNRVRESLLTIQGNFESIARGDISKLGEFRKIGKQSENDRLLPAEVAMMQTIQDLIDETDRIAEAAAGGRLEVRGDAVKFPGKYQTIVVGLNKALDAMVQPIAEASVVLEEMAQGNLERTMSGAYEGDYARIKDVINGTITSFNQVLGEINRVAGQVATASHQVADGSQALSQGANEQAATIEELSSSIEEIAGQTKRNALCAGQANELVNQSKEKAVRGNEQMQALLTAMNEINKGATNISKIIEAIDEIAFQTNILALNAAVEAARAGQYGKGFAVVAEEVRNLAGRSAEAAKETTELIESSMQKAADGTRIANQTATSLKEIVADVTQAADLVAEIASASNDQATGIAQINLGINQVS